MVCIQMIMCYIIKENKQFKNQWLTWSKKSVDVYMYFSLLLTYFFLWVCVCRRVCVNVHYNVHQHVEYIYVFIWPHIQKHTTESFIQRSIQYWCLWILEIPTMTKIEPSIFITLIDIIYYQNPRKLSCVCSQGLDLHWKSHLTCLNGYTWRWSHVFS